MNSDFYVLHAGVMNFRNFTVRHIAADNEVQNIPFGLLQTLHGRQRTPIFIPDHQMVLRIPPFNLALIVEPGATIRFATMIQQRVTCYFKKQGRARFAFAVRWCASGTQKACLYIHCKMI
jgi:hypothetical protein